MVPNAITKVRYMSGSFLKVLTRLTSGEVRKTCGQRMAPHAGIVARVEHRDPEAKRQSSYNLPGHYDLTASHYSSLGFFNLIALAFVSLRLERRVLPSFRAKCRYQNCIDPVS
jgi:hypothetical protein